MCYTEVKHGGKIMKVTETLNINDAELSETFVRASGPGGQNVNNVSTAVQLRFDVRHSPSLPEEVRTRLLYLAHNRITKEGVLVILAQRYRTQEQNRQDARDRLIELIRRALYKPKKRIPTAPSRASIKRNLDEKKSRGDIKRARKPVRGDDV